MCRCQKVHQIGLACVARDDPPPNNDSHASNGKRQVEWNRAYLSLPQRGSYKVVSLKITLT